MRFNYLFLMLLFMISCHESVEFRVRRVIVNESSVPISLYVYSNGDEIESFSILSNEKNTKEESCRRERGDTECDLLTGTDIRWYLVGDSVRILFNNEKVQSFGVYDDNSFTERTPFVLPLSLENDEHNTGYVKTIEGDTQVFTFTITEEDYENAEPLGN